MGINIFAFVVVLGILIFFHELGHFLVARFFGVGVERFSLGFGPRLFGKKVGITDYRLSAIPLGGYVKMIGEEPDAEIDPADIAISFTHQHVVKRILIVAAGPIFNVLLAVMIFFVFFSITGIEDIKPDIRRIEKNSVAMNAGMQVGDRITAIDGSPVASWYDINRAVDESEGRALDITVLRDNGTLEFVLTPELKQGTDILGDQLSYYDLGISGFPELKAIVGDVTIGFPAEKAGLKKDDQIVSINGIPIETWRQMQSLISSSGGAELTLKIRRNTELLTVALTPQLVGKNTLDGEIQDRFLIGISALQTTIPDEDQVTPGLNPARALLESVERTVFICTLTVKSVVKMIEGSIPKDNLGGPIMIAKLAGDHAKEGIGQLVQFIAFISINLAILNILPIPVLDGGHLLFFFIELVIRRPVSIRIRELAQQAGLFVLILLMIFVFYNDITRFFFSR